MKPSILFTTLVTCYVLSMTSAKCPSPYQEFNRACHFVSEDGGYTAYNAETYCNIMGGYLVNIDSELENNYTIGEIQAKPNIAAGYWTGGSYNDRDGWVWQKVDANGALITTPISDPPIGVFGPGEPMAGLGGVFFGQQRQLAIMTRARSVNYKWYSEDERDLLGFVCEADYIQD